MAEVSEFPDWIKGSFDDLVDLAFKGMRIRRAYQIFQQRLVDGETLLTETGAEVTYMDRITDKSAELGIGLEEDAPGGASGIQAVEDVLKVFGTVKGDKTGTNYVATRSDWLVFGVLTGFNLARHYGVMKNEKGEVLDWDGYTPKEIAPDPGFAWWESFFNTKKYREWEVGNRKMYDIPPVHKSSLEIKGYMAHPYSNPQSRPGDAGEMGRFNDYADAHIYSYDRKFDLVGTNMDAVGGVAAYGDDDKAQVKLRTGAYVPFGDGYDGYGSLLDPHIIFYLNVMKPEGTDRLLKALVGVANKIHEEATRVLTQGGVENLYAANELQPRGGQNSRNTTHYPQMAKGTGGQSGGGWRKDPYEGGLLKGYYQWNTKERGNHHWRLNNKGEGEWDGAMADYVLPKHWAMDTQTSMNRAWPWTLGIRHTLPLDHFVDYYHYQRIMTAGDPDAWPNANTEEGYTARFAGTPDILSYGTPPRVVGPKRQLRYSATANGSLKLEDPNPWVEDQAKAEGFSVGMRPGGEAFDVRGSAKPGAPSDERYKATYKLANASAAASWNIVYLSPEYKEFEEALQEYVITTLNEPLEGTQSDIIDGKWTLMDQYVDAFLDFFNAGIIEGDQTDAISDSTATSDGANTAAELPKERLKQIINYRNIKPLDFQCFLTENIAALADVQMAQANYKNIVKISTWSDPSYVTPASLMSVLKNGGRHDSIKEILNLPPTVYAAMSPYIKLYRVDYTEGGEPGKPCQPVKQMEIPIPNFVDPRDIDQLTGKGAGRYKGWGLQSFSWSLDGVQPETVDNNITATLRFYFQSIQDLFQGSMAAGQPTPNPLDLLISSRTLKQVAGKDKDAAEEITRKQGTTACKDTVKDNLHQAYEGANFRIKVVAGWSTPELHTLMQLLPDKGEHASLKKRAEALQKAVDDTRTALYLQQTRHDLDFQQDGSISLTINYQAALTGMMTSPRTDILGRNVPGMDAIMKSKEAAITDARKGVADASEVAVAAKKAGAVGQTQERLTIAKKKLQDALQAKSDMVNMDRLRKYKRFLATLYGRDDDNKVTSSAPKIYTLEVHPEEVFKMPIAQVRDPKKRAQRALMRMSTTPGERGFALRESATMASTDRNTDLLAAVQGKIDTAGTKKNEDLARTLNQQWKEQVGAEENILIPYFYLGDLIDTILENNTDLRADSDPRAMIFLGPMDVLNPLILFATANVDEVLCADNLNDAALMKQLHMRGLALGESRTMKRINIGDLPISLDLFNVWFKNNVIEKEKNTYYLQHFIKDLCSYLATDALNGECYGGRNNINNIRFDAAPVSFHNRNKSGARYIKHGSTIKAIGDAHELDALGKRMAALTPENDIPPDDIEEKDKKKYDATMGLVVYCTDSKPKKRNGDYDYDTKSGIYHNYIGSAAGLVKNINFSRMDQEYLREAKIQKYGELGAAQLRELYSANIDMVGNALFRNGQYTFIWPTMVAQDRYLARLLGLGGYFLVTGVNHSISPAGYNVQVTALQEGLAFLTGETSARAQIVKDIPEIENSPDQDDPVVEEFQAGYDAADVDPEEDDDGDGFGGGASRPGGARGSSW